MKKIIVTTTINPVTEAIARYDAMTDWELIVIGDLKTPKDYKLKRGLYVSPEDQPRINPKLSDAIGWNSIQRRNFGFLLALEYGADLIAVIDDDNIPQETWGQNIYVGQEIEVDYYQTDAPAFDSVGATNYPHLWHRGFPLQLLSTRDYSQCTRRRLKVDIQADFWNGDPDIDAVCRMEHAPECVFGTEKFPMASNRLSPFNSQNTFFSRDALKHYFLYNAVGRMDDIWAGYYLQSLGFQVIFNQATVYQQRNEHDLTVDFTKEILGYKHNLQLVQDLALDPNSIVKYLPGSAVYAWQLYQQHIGTL